MAAFTVIGLFVVIFFVDAVFKEEDENGNSTQLWTIAIALTSLPFILTYKGSGAAKGVLFVVWLLFVIISILRKHSVEKRERELEVLLHNAREHEKQEQEQLIRDSVGCIYCGGYIRICGKDENRNEAMKRFESAVCPCCGKTVYKKDYPGIDDPEEFPRIDF